MRTRTAGLSSKWRRVARASVMAPSAHAMAAAVCAGGMH